MSWMVCCTSPTQCYPRCQRDQGGAGLLCTYTPSCLSGINSLINQPIVRHGFHHDGTVPKSTTCETTIELENLRLVRLEEQMGTSLGRSDIERWAMSACTKFSSAWIFSPPDHFGFIENNLFREVFAAHLGQTLPAIHSYVGGFFDRNQAR